MAADRRTFGQRLRTPQVARAMFSPSAILAAGAGAAVAILAGGWAVAPVVAVGGWAGRVLLAVPRRDRSGDVRAGSLPEPWRSFVRDAQQASGRFAALLSKVQPGPLHDELASIGLQVDEGVRACWDVAKRGAALDAARASLQLPRAEAELQRLQGERSLRAQQRMGLESLDAAIGAVQRQLQAGQRVEATAFEARDKLRTLNAQLDEAVAAAVEVAVRPAVGTGGLGDQVQGVVDQLGALRQALDEAEAASDQLTTTSPSPTLEQR